MDIGGDISGTCPPSFGRPKNLPCLDWKCSENGENDTKSLKKKKKMSFWRSTIFDHLPPCGFGDYIINVWS